MGLILDSSAVIAAERQGDTVTQFLRRITALTGDQEAALSAIGLTQLVQGVYRARTAEVRARRRSFVHELLQDIEVYPYTRDEAFLAGKLNGEQQGQGITIPFADLLIGATALTHRYSVLTVNLRHFRLIPGLSVIQL